MVLHIKDIEADMLVRRLARQRGIGLTDAIREAAREAIAADEAGRFDRSQPLKQRLQPLLDRLDRLPRSDVSTDKAYFDAMWEEGR